MKMYDSLLQYCFRLLGRKSYSEHQLRGKLKLRAKRIKLEEPEMITIIDQIVARLKELNYINDRQVIINYLQFHLPMHPVGKWGFIHDMQKRGIPKDQALEEWDKADINERELIKEFLKSKERLFRSLTGMKQKQKVQRLLASRGFASDAIWSALDKIR